jgi:hypothetical protein
MTQTKGTPLGTRDRAQLRRLVGLLGESESARKIGIHRQSLARVLAGLPVYAGTRALIAQNLAKSQAAAVLK